MNKPIKQRYLNVEGLSLYTSIPKSTIYQLKHRGTIPYTKVGASLLFDINKIDEWLDKNHILASPSATCPDIYRPINNNKEDEIKLSKANFKNAKKEFHMIGAPQTDQRKIKIKKSA